MSKENISGIEEIDVDMSGNLILYVKDEEKWIKSDEKAHLLCLQEKLNACLSYIQRGKYKEDYPEDNIRQAIIEIRFKYAITEHCKRYLQIVQGQIGEYAIKLEVYAGKE